MGQLFSHLQKLGRIISGWFLTLNSENSYNQAVEYYTTYLLEEDPDDLGNALKNLRSAQAAWQEEQTPESSKPDGYPDLLLNLGTACFSRYTKTNRMDARSFDSAVELYNELREMPNVKKETQAKCLLMLGKALSTKSDYDRTTDRLGEAINFLQNALALCNAKAEGQEEKPIDVAAVKFQCLYDLATAYDVRYKYDEAIEDLNEAVKWNYKFKNEVSGEHPDRVSCLYNLARQLFTKYERAQKEKVGTVLLDINLDKSRGADDLEAADRIAKQAQNLLSGDNSVRFQPLKEGLDKLLRVIREHEEVLSRRSSISSGSSISTKTRSKNPSLRSLRDTT